MVISLLKFSNQVVVDFILVIVSYILNRNKPEQERRFLEMFKDNFWGSILLGWVYDSWYSVSSE